ncbi:hypothetical protein NDJ44_22320 [Escherichia coli]|uniref:hypothetical protein n=1 Tax=Escherichia coli TaxID=562 RepID=UPI0020C7B53D|nr:hypothetical protein [Escherichia coli]MCP8724407.1 hypothetical protein [Escherichia coli]
MKNLSALEAVLDYDKPSRRFLDELNENQMKDLSGKSSPSSTGASVIPSGTRKTPIGCLHDFVGFSASSRSA